jgi:hypothetical protein
MTLCRFSRHVLPGMSKLSTCRQLHLDLQMPCQGKSWNIHGCIMIVSWSDRAYYDPFIIPASCRFSDLPLSKKNVFKEHVQKIDTSPSWEPPERRQLPRAHMVLLSGRGYCIAKIARMFNASEYAVRRYGLCNAKHMVSMVCATDLAMAALEGYSHS